MSENYTNFNAVELPDDLFEKIMCRIHKEEQRALKRKRAFFSVALVFSAVAFTQTLRMTKAGLVESGFVEFASLIFSDPSTILMFWQSFATALLESIPVMSIAAFLAAVFAFLESCKLFARNIKAISACSSRLN